MALEIRQIKGKFAICDDRIVENIVISGYFDELEQAQAEMAELQTPRGAKAANLAETMVSIDKQIEKATKAGGMLETSHVIGKDNKEVKSTLTIKTQAQPAV